MALIYRLVDYILVDFRRDLDLKFSRNLLHLNQKGPIAAKQRANMSIQV